MRFTQLRGIHTAMIPAIRNPNTSHGAIMANTWTNAINIAFIFSSPCGERWVQRLAEIACESTASDCARSTFWTIFKYLPACYDAAVAKKANPAAREKMANAATMAGMAFANAFLGVMHSMAHKLGSFHHIPHGIANALMMEEVLRFNADPVPRKMGTFPQYDHPHALERYLEIADALGIKGKSKGEQFNNFVKAIRSRLSSPTCRSGFRSSPQRNRRATSRRRTTSSSSTGRASSTSSSRIALPARAMPGAGRITEAGC